MSSMMDWALYYLSQGLPVFPVQGKIPLIKWGIYQERLPSEEEIKEWWGRWPLADIGMVTGPISSRLVVDIDSEEGERAISKFSVPSTLEVKTRRGRQLHFICSKFPEAKTTIVGLLPTVDVRGEGGYVKLPPSSFSDGSGRYAWGETLAVSETPQWLVDLLINNSKPRVVTSSETSWLQEKLKGLTNGNRNQTFCSLAGSLRSRGWSSSDIFSLLDPHARRVGFELEELQKVCDSVGQYAPKEAVQNEAVFTFQTDADKYLADLAERAKHLEPEFCTGFPSLDRLTKGFPRQNVYVIGAPTNGGKTQFVLSNILALLKKGKKVLYFSTEMPQSEIKDRFNAIGARIPIEELTSGFLKSTSRDRLVKFLREFDSSKFIISPEDTPTLETIKNAIERVMPDIVVLDHIHHIKTKTDNRRNDIDDFVMGFKKLMLAHNMPGIVTSQLRRKDSIDGKPVQYTMHDFKESGGIENEAGVCLLLCPPNEWMADKVQHVTAYIPKNRHGRREVRFTLEFDTEIAAFSEPGF